MALVFPRSQSGAAPLSIFIKLEAKRGKMQEQKGAKFPARQKLPI
jgi:hypothetical protein